jgi:hypothetical protein
MVFGALVDRRPKWTASLRFGAVATLVLPPADADVVPPPGTFIVHCRESLFNEAKTQFLPAIQGSWGTAILGAPAGWGTVETAERGKEAPVKEEEDIHGKLYKAGLGDERQRLAIKCRMRLQTEVETGDEFIMLGVTWFVASAMQIWAEAEWAELNVNLVRWPTLKQRPSFSYAEV